MVLRRHLHVRTVSPSREHVPGGRHRLDGWHRKSQRRAYGSRSPDVAWCRAFPCTSDRHATVVARSETNKPQEELQGCTGRDNSISARRRRSRSRRCWRCRALASPRRKRPPPRSRSTPTISAAWCAARTARRPACG